jgi:hypothetical protein
MWVAFAACVGAGYAAGLVYVYERTRRRNAERGRSW